MNIIEFPWDSSFAIKSLYSMEKKLTIELLQIIPTSCKNSRFGSIKNKYIYIYMNRVKTKLDTSFIYLFNLINGTAVRNKTNLS